MKLGLAREIRAKPGTPIWRRDEAGLTAAGLKAIAVRDGSEEAIEPSETAQPQPLPEAKTGGNPGDVGRRQAHAVAPRDGSKLGLVIDLLRRADGATIVDLSEATGWLPHTTRAALSGLRMRGFSVVSQRLGARDSVYRIARAVADCGDSSAVRTDAADGHDGELQAA